MFGQPVVRSESVCAISLRVSFYGRGRCCNCKAQLRSMHPTKLRNKAGLTPAGHQVADPSSTMGAAREVVVDVSVSRTLEVLRPVSGMRSLIVGRPAAADAGDFPVTPPQTGCRPH